MSRSLTVILLSLCALAAGPQGVQNKQGTGPETKPPQSSLSVDQILDRYFEAIGGAAAFRKLNSRVTKMTLAIGDSDISCSFENYAEAPNKAVMIGQIKLPNGIEFEISRGFNGTSGWSLNVAEGGYRELGGAELEMEKRDSQFNWDIRLRELYPKITLIGRATVGANTTYCLEATPKNGLAEKWYFDVQTGLLIRKETIFESAIQDRITIETYYDDYREVDGVKLPFIIRQPVNKYTFKVDEVRHNVQIDAAKFRSPGAAFDELSIRRATGAPAIRKGALYLSLLQTGNQLSIRAELDGKYKSFTPPKGAEEIAAQLIDLFSKIDKGDTAKEEIIPALEKYGALFYSPIAELVDSSSEIQFVIPGRFLKFPLDLLYFKKKPLFLQKPVTYSFEKVGDGRFPLSIDRTALIISDKSTDPENGCQIVKDMLPSSSYYSMEEMSLARLRSTRTADILLISAHGMVQFANTDFMGMGFERLRPDNLSHINPHLVYFDSCNMGISAHFIQSFRERGTEFYVAPILSNEAGESSTKTIEYFFERLKAGDTPSRAMFYTRKKLFELYGEKQGYNKLLFRAFPFRVYSLN